MNRRQGRGPSIALVDLRQVPEAPSLIGLIPSIKRRSRHDSHRMLIAATAASLIACPAMAQTTGIASERLARQAPGLHQAGRCRPGACRHHRARQKGTSRPEVFERQIRRQWHHALCSRRQTTNLGAEVESFWARHHLAGSHRLSRSDAADETPFSCRTCCEKISLNFYDSHRLAASRRDMPPT